MNIANITPENITPEERPIIAARAADLAARAADATNKANRETTMGQTSSALEYRQRATFLTLQSDALYRLVA